MAKSLEQVRLFLDDVHTEAARGATARYLVSEGSALHSHDLRVEHPALVACAHPAAIPPEVWNVVIEAIRLREGLA
jgi:hypothetical protein